ncbi:MAG: cytochrome c1 [Alphaproteobacteria bacterium]
MRLPLAALTLTTTLVATTLVAAAFVTAAPARAAGDGEHAPAQKWSFDGVLGSFDRKQLQRGLKVYTAVCATCHGLRHVAYRNLVDLGLTPSEAKAVAATKEVTEIGDDGQPKTRKADLKDRFVSPFPNVQAAAASNNGKAPPDLSLIVKAREDGSNYVFGLLTGYAEPPKDWKDEDGKPRTLESGQNYNKYFPGHVIAMVPPLTGEDQGKDQVGYGKDDPKPTVEQMARDVTAFLTWASEPSMEQRKRTGIKVILFMIIFTGVFFVVKRRVWRNVH